MKERLLNCNGCTACCIKEAIFLHPECGDIVEFYETDTYNGRHILKHTKNSEECIYLTPNGCGIYDVRPTICRELDCRLVVRKLGFTRSRKMVRTGQFSRGVLAAAMRRM